MKRAIGKTGIDWLEFEIHKPDEDGEMGYYIYRFHLNFLLSNWNCLFGNGCKGIFGFQDSTFPEDIGCCKKGAWFTDNKDVSDIEANIALLKPEDWDAELRQAYEKDGYSVIFKREGDEPDDEVNGRTRVVDGACIFANRANGSVGSTGKIGCAFHHMGEREGKDHVDSMPDICWQLPLRLQEDSTERGLVSSIYPWDVEEWGGEDEDGTHNSWMCAWCVDMPDMYNAENPVYITLEHELRTLVGDDVYEEFARQVDLRRGNQYSPMPGQLVNGGRPLLPLLVENRTPTRVNPNA